MKGKKRRAESEYAGDKKINAQICLLKTATNTKSSKWKTILENNLR